MLRKQNYGWSVLWRQGGRFTCQYLLYDYGLLPVMFNTRRAARDYIKKRYGYIKDRSDLRREPYCWRLPIPIKVRVIMETV